MGCLIECSVWSQDRGQKVLELHRPPPCSHGPIDFAVSSSRPAEGVRGGGGPAPGPVRCDIRSGASRTGHTQGVSGPQSPAWTHQDLLVSIVVSVRAFDGEACVSSEVQRENPHLRTGSRSQLLKGHFPGGFTQEDGFSECWDPFWRIRHQALHQMNK